MAVLIAFVAGIMLILQSAINAQLRNLFGSPFLAATISFIVGTFALIIVCIFMKIPIPSINTISQAKWWHYSGGVLGVFYILAVIALVPKLGTANLFGLIIAGQMVAAMTFDHFGLFGITPHQINPPRIVGAALLVLSVYIIHRF